MRCIELTALSVLLAALAIAQYPVPSQGGGGVGPPGTQAFTPVQNAGTDVVCALHADVIAGLTCNNQVTDGTTATAFASTVSIPAGTMSANTTTANFGFGYVGTGSSPSMIISIKLGSTVVFTAGTQAGAFTTGWALNCNLTASATASTTTPIVVLCAVGANTNVQHNTLITATNKSVAVDTTIAQTLSVSVIFGTATAGNAIWLYGISPGSGGAAGANAAPAYASVQNAGTDVVCAKGADTITGLTCNNAADATTATAFSSTITIPAGTMSANTTGVNLLMGGISSGASAIISIKLGSTVIYTSGNINGTAVGRFACQITATATASTTTPIAASCAALSPGSISGNKLLSSSVKSIAVDTTVAQTLSVTAIFGAATTQNALWLYSISPGSTGPVGPAGPAGPSAYASTQNAGGDVVCALHADVITGLTCNNAVTDGTTETAFNSTVTIPAGTLSSNKTAVNFTFGYIATATVPTITFKVKLNGTTIYTSNATAAGAGTSGFALNCNLVAAAIASATTPVIFACAMPGPNNSSIRNTLITNANLSVAVNTTVSATLTITAQFGAATTQNAMWLYSIAP